jgi:hypothetical protein
MGAYDGWGLFHGGRSVPVRRLEDSGPQLAETCEEFPFPGGGQTVRAYLQKAMAGHVHSNGDATQECESQKEHIDSHFIKI